MQTRDVCVYDSLVRNQKASVDYFVARILDCQLLCYFFFWQFSLTFGDARVPDAVSGGYRHVAVARGGWAALGHDVR